MYKQGCSIIFFTEDKDQVEFLFFLRDNKDEIPYPNTWDLLGGNLEENESPEDCITREMWEEIGIVLSEFKKFRAVEFLDRLEHTFYKRVQKNFLGSYNENNIILKRPNEGQLLKWFSIDQVSKMNLAFDFDLIVFRFYFHLLYSKT